jgi:peptidoglycan/xylan/chitin deacetylase (PgdA/CDA1 family)
MSLMHVIDNVARQFVGRYSLLSLLGSNGPRVPLYHHLAEQDNEFINHLGIRIHPEEFAWHLDLIARDYDVIDLETTLSGKLPKRPLLITFDDAYRSVLDVAAPMLQERGLPAVFFLSADIVSGDKLMLDNLINYLGNEVAVEKIETAITGKAPQTHSVVALISSVIGNLPYERRSVLGDELAEHFGIDSRGLCKQANLYLNKEDLPALIEAGFDIGCHTGTHADCGSLDQAGADAEIRMAKLNLERMTGRKIRAFSFPYDVAGSDAALRAIRDSGFEAEFKVSSRANSRKQKGPVWYRMSMRSVHDPESFFVNVEVLPRLRALRHSLN